MNLIFINEKGGTGKTTISFNIAVEFQRNKYNVILTDADRQESLTSINNLREKNKFTIRNIETIEKNNDKTVIKFPKTQCYAKFDSKKTLSNFVDNFSENCDDGGQNLLNLKAPNPPTPFAKGE